MATKCPVCSWPMDYIGDRIVGTSANCPDDPDVVEEYQCHNCGKVEYL